MLDFLYYAVSWVLLRWHDLFNLIGLDPNGGPNWVLSIVMLVVTARLLLFRLFIKQVHYQRKMQEFQPRMQAIREKYKNDKAAQQREMMALQQQEGFNPLAGCLPLVAQLPVFIGLLHVLRHLATAATYSGGGAGTYPTSHLTLYGFSQEQTLSAGKATFFGAPISAQFQNTNNIIGTLGGDVTTTRVVIAILLVVSAAATFITQRQVMARATTTPEGTAALVQKAMLYLIPAGVLASGFVFNFPLGVLIYWFTSNLWTMAQQFYINKFHPNTPSEKAAAEAAAASTQAGRALAPKPGVKPDRTRARGAGATATASTPDLTKSDAPATTRPGGAANGAPKPGQKPTTGRPAAGARPQPARKSGQAKKRR